MPKEPKFEIDEIVVYDNKAFSNNSFIEKLGEPSLFKIFEIRKEGKLFPQFLYRGMILGRKTGEVDRYGEVIWLYKSGGTPEVSEKHLKPINEFGWRHPFVPFSKSMERDVQAFFSYMDSF